MPLFAPDPNETERPMWRAGKRGFVLAALSSAVGIGNIWRFPSITFQYGGAGFFFPYLLALFFFGIPLLILEISLGQKF
jgi:NSS family neurotransmitter:Na+ symporter